MTEPSQVFEAFHEIVQYARQLNTHLQIPEILLIGRQGHGKSSFIEAFLGNTCNVVGENAQGAHTKRAIHFNLINNPECDTPRITIKRDPTTKSRDTEVVMDTLEDEIRARNSINAAPIHINYEYKNCWNLTLIDTPGWVPAKEQTGMEIGPDEIEELLFDLARPTHRIIVCVEDVIDGSNSEMIPLAKRLDPRLDRTVFVFNKFADQLKNFGSARDLNRYMSNVSSIDARCFFTSLLSYEQRSKVARDRKAFENQLEENTSGDMKLLEQLQYDRKFLNSIGVMKLNKHLNELTWKKYQDNIPELLKRLRSQKKSTEDSLKEIRSRLKSLEINRLRGTASRYAMQFLQAIERLLSGTLDGSPSINGQTLDEEKGNNDVGDWRNSNWQPIAFDANEWKIPHAYSKLYGGQQFERLLAEFKAVLDHEVIGKLSTHDIATAAGPLKLSNASNCTWAASDIAQKQIQRHLMPMLTQLFKRATYIFDRLVDVVEKMLANQKKRQRPQKEIPDAIDEIDSFPFFIHNVKNLYFNFVEKTAESCLKKCKDEFYSTRLIHWELTNLDKKAITQPGSNPEETIIQLATETFNSTRDRITKNIMLKCYNYFLVPMQTELWSEIQGKITCLTEKDIEELFEVRVSTQKLKDEESRLDELLSSFSEQEVAFAKNANLFSRASPKDISF